MGRALWQTPALDAQQRSGIRERFFDDGAFPPVEESKKAFAEAKKESDARPAPFAGRTSPLVSLSVTDYGQRLEHWMEKLLREPMTPEAEDLEILRAVVARIKVGFQLEKEGCDLPKGHGDRGKLEEPLRGLTHGPRAPARVVSFIG